LANEMMNDKLQLQARLTQFDGCHERRHECHALACSGANGGWILISADVCAFASPLAKQVRADIASRTGLRFESVMLSATHTHSGPLFIFQLAFHLNPPVHSKPAKGQFSIDVRYESVNS